MHDIASNQSIWLCLQWLLQWRSNQQQSPAFDACVAATALGVANLVASCGMRALQAPGVKAVLACIAHSASAALVMRSLLASRFCRDAPGIASPPFNIQLCSKSPMAAYSTNPLVLSECGITGLSFHWRLERLFAHKWQPCSMGPCHVSLAHWGASSTSKRPPASALVVVLCCVWMHRK